MAMLGLPLADWRSTPDRRTCRCTRLPTAPNSDRMLETTFRMVGRLAEHVQSPRDRPRPGVIPRCSIQGIGEFLPDDGIIGTVTLLIGGELDSHDVIARRGFDWLAPRVDDHVHLVDDVDYMDTTTEGIPPPLHSTGAGGGRRSRRTVGSPSFQVLRRRSHVHVVHDVRPRPRPFEPDEIVLDGSPIPTPPSAWRTPLIGSSRGSTSSTCCGRRSGACPTTASTHGEGAVRDRSARSTLRAPARDVHARHHRDHPSPR